MASDDLSIFGTASWEEITRLCEEDPGVTEEEKVVAHLAKEALETKDPLDPLSFAKAARHVLELKPGTSPFLARVVDLVAYEKQQQVDLSALTLDQKVMLLEALKESPISNESQAQTGSRLLRNSAKTAISDLMPLLKIATTKEEMKSVLEMTIPENGSRKKYASTLAHQHYNERRPLSELVKPNSQIVRIAQMVSSWVHKAPKPIQETVIPIASIDTDFTKSKLGESADAVISQITDPIKKLRLLALAAGVKDSATLKTQLEAKQNLSADLIELALVIDPADRPLIFQHSDEALRLLNFYKNNRDEFPDEIEKLRPKKEAKPLSPSDHLLRYYPGDKEALQNLQGAEYYKALMTPFIDFFNIPAIEPREEMAERLWKMIEARVEETPVVNQESVTAKTIPFTIGALDGVEKLKLTDKGVIDLSPLLGIKSIQEVDMRDARDADWETLFLRGKTVRVVSISPSAFQAGGKTLEILKTPLKGKEIRVFEATEKDNALAEALRKQGASVTLFLKIP